MVVNSCFEDLERRVGLKRVWEFVSKVGKKRNERVNKILTFQNKEARTSQLRLWKGI